ncbi:hypothetical protein Hanom_Chr14g01285501 [Helianthus anomalus]
MMKLESKIMDIWYDERIIVKSQRWHSRNRGYTTAKRGRNGLELKCKQTII